MKQKRLLSLCLAAALAITMIPVGSARAAEPEEVQNMQAQEDAAGEAALHEETVRGASAKGQAQERISAEPALEAMKEERAVKEEDYKYEENEDGTVTITGYSGSEKELVIPDTLGGKSVTSIGGDAFSSCNSLTSVIIPGSVESIGDMAFYDCGSMTSVEIQEGVKSIGDSAFSGCDSLTSVIIPGSVTSIGSRAFNGTSWLKACREANPLVVVNHILIDGSTCEGAVKIPEGVKSIGDDAFSGCSSLTSVVIPGSVTSMGGDAFWSCSSLTEIQVEENNENYSSYSGILYDKEKTVLIRCPEGKSGEVKIPGSVTSIGDHAFRFCYNLTSVELPEGVKSIGDYAFQNCWRLTSIEIPESVEVIGEMAFSSCGSLTNVVIPGSVTSIGEDAFAGTPWLIARIKENPLVIVNHILITGGTCEGAVEIPEGVTSIGDYAFRKCFRLTSVEIPGSVTSIGAGAFGECISLTSVEIPGSVTSIGSMVFYGCDSLTGIEVEENNANYSSDSGILYDKGKTELIRCPEGKSGEVKIPGSVTSIGNYAFGCCDSLTSVEIPGSVKSIGDWAFWSSSLTLTVDKGSYAETYAKASGIKYIISHPHQYQTKVTKATTKKNGKLTKTCSVCGDKRETVIYAPKTMKLSKTSYTYNGKAPKPSVTVTDKKGRKLKSGTDYTVKYPGGCKDAGSYTVTVTFKGNYSGSMKQSFTIVPKGTSLAKVTAAKKAITVKWKKQASQTTGYEIEYSTSSKFAKKATKTVTVPKNKTTSKKITKLKAKKKYYVRVRAYKAVKVNKKNTKLYSAWSKAKSVTTK